MKIGINGRFLLNRITGVERYARSVLKEFVPLANLHGHECVLMAPNCSQPPVETFGCSLEQAGPAFLSLTPAGKHLWEQLVLPTVARRSGVDILVNLTNTSPINFAPCVVTLHDVAWMANPGWFSKSFLLAYRTFVEPAARRAAAIVTVSEFSRDEIIRRLNIAADKITVLHNGVDTKFGAATECPSGLNEPYFLHVATADPRKDLATVIKAASLGKESAALPPVVCIGSAPSHFSQTLKDGLGDNVRWLGYVDDSQLQSLYSGALAVVSASLYEGFGLPLLEAMASKIPVVASDIPAHRELLGSCGLFFEPANARQLCDVLLQISNDSRLRTQLAESGFARARDYSWNTHAAGLLRIIEEVVARN